MGRSLELPAQKGKTINYCLEFRLVLIDLWKNRWSHVPNYVWWECLLCKFHPTCICTQSTLYVHIAKQYGGEGEM